MLVRESVRESFSGIASNFPLVTAIGLGKKVESRTRLSTSPVIRKSHFLGLRSGPFKFRLDRVTVPCTDLKALSAPLNPPNDESHG